MRKAFVLMTALPPTKGHLNLIKFASRLMKLESGGRVTVIVCTQPSEPYAAERYMALGEAARGLGNVSIRRMHKQIEQNPEADGFWEMWTEIMEAFTARPGDYVVASEPYGKAVADLFGGVFMPYDLERGFAPIKATNVRNSTGILFADIIPEFQKHLVSTITIWGAESTGKTTLGKHFANYGLPGMPAGCRARFVFEYARPMLESTSPDINIPVMERIWQGQLALQEHVKNDLGDYPVIIQDTDLYSTIGYWKQPHWEAELGPVPEQLVRDAERTRSDLYIILRSNIDFEPDPIRYGGDRRESPDEFWIRIAELYKLPYVVLDSDDVWDRWLEAGEKGMTALVESKLSSIHYDREGY